MAKTCSLRVARTPCLGAAADRPAADGAAPAGPAPNRRKLPLRYPIAIDLAAAVALTCLSALASVAAAPDGAAAEILAAQTRSQGFACTSPVTATRDRAASRPNVTVWVLTCGNARYHMRLVPDMAAQITQLE